MKKETIKLLKRLLKKEFYSIDALTDFSNKREEVIQSCVDLGFNDLADELRGDMYNY